MTGSHQGATPAGRPPFVAFRPSLVGTADSVSDRGADADYVVRTEEIAVVENVVIVRLGTNEDISPDVIPDAASEMHQKVIRAGIAGAKRVAVIRGLVAVKAGRLPANAAEQIGPDFLADAGLVNAVEGKLNGPVRLPQAAKVAERSPGCIKACAQTLVKDHIAADVGIKATSLRTSKVSGVDTASSCPRRQHGAKTDHGITLLSRGEINKNKKRQNGREEGELSQVKPPVMVAAGA